MASGREHPRFRVGVMGAGAVGGYVGGLLARAGHHVTLIARGDHLRALKAHGLQVRSQQGDFEVREEATDVPLLFRLTGVRGFRVRVEATDRPEAVGPVDLVLFTVKTYHNAQAIPQVRPLVGPTTTVLTLQNGVESWEQLQAGLGTGRVLPGAIYVEARVEAPGVVRQQGNVARVVLGEADGSASTRAQAIAGVLREAGLPAEVSGDILKVLWTKWLFIVALAGATSASRSSIADLLAVPASRRLVIDLMREVEAVGRARGVRLDADVVEQTLRYMETEARSLKASMHTDLDSGRPLELEALSGAVVRLGEQVGVPTPANGAIYALLKPHDLQHRARAGLE